MANNNISHRNNINDICDQQKNSLNYKHALKFLNSTKHNAYKQNLISSERA